MSDYKDNKHAHSNSPTRIFGLSPEKYGRTAFKELMYTPEKLSQNILYKEVTVTKRVEEEKIRIRELDSLSALQQEKIRQLETELDTIRKSLELQIETYKKMLKDQEEEYRKHLKVTQTSYNEEIHKLLADHEEEAKVAQAEKEELERQIEQLMAKIEELNSQLEQHGGSIDELTRNLELTSQNLANTQDRLEKTEQQARATQQKLSDELQALRNQLERERESFKAEIESIINEKNREIENIKHLHQTELDKQENKRASEMATKNLELKELRSTFEAEAKRLEDIISNRDAANQALAADLNKEKDKVLALTKHYEAELTQLVHQKERILDDFSQVDAQRIQLGNVCHSLETQLKNQTTKNEALIDNLKGELTHKNMELARQNERLIRTADAYELELAALRGEALKIQRDRQVDNTRIKITSEQYAEDNRSLILEVKNLREVLLESSLEMDKCKQEFIRMDHDKDRLLRVMRELEEENLRLKGLLAEKDVESRQWRENYMVVKSRY